ncbi:S-adenosyl-L-methionine-dependent methyltransferase [Plectosphaerella plurivora]|uniref:S-adenosyl-L-methionine-dependent methyltransferase n=1 Tax=Plectosphaerella plurivora TaxID=936078 RepID=A0A9P8V889_9PEZI|nr:S-adenosyl-L-methionine-dependent methyltransferase [Plectosphaerella plurivora]
MSSPDPIINDNPAIQSYYASLESRIGYRLVLGGTRHYAYWDTDTWFPLPLGPALRRMESKLLAALSLPSGATVLDAGCGVGHVALYMAREGGLRVRAIDIVDHHVVKARRNIAAAEASGSISPGQISVAKMDYHHLEAIGDASLDGVYTMETLVHATNPAAVLAGFMRALRPGGRIALFEYDHDLDGAAADASGVAGWMVRDMRRVNELAAMPTHQKARPGFFRDLLKEAGFEQVVVRDYTDNVRPMLRLFYYFAIVPYLIVRLLGLERYFANTMAGVLGYAAGKHCRYVAISARKPGKELEVEVQEPENLKTR